MNIMLKNNLAINLNITLEEIRSGSDEFGCDACIRGKQNNRKHFKNSKAVRHLRATQPYDTLHIDVKDMGVNTIGGARYIYAIVDDYSRAGFVFLLKSKDQYETVDALESFNAHYVRPYGYKINHVRFDRGESKSNLMVQLLKTIGSTYEYSPTNDHQSNGIAESYIQTIDNDQHTLQVAGDFASNCWGELVNTAASIRRRNPNRSNPDRQSHIKWFITSLLI